MLRGFGWLLAVLLLVAGSLWIYPHLKSGTVPGNGDAFSRNEPSDATGGDGSSDKYGSSAPIAIPAAVPAPAPVAAAPQPPATQAAMPYATAAPPSDSIAPNPANGMAFGGNGKYQWYRQGNLTWRIDTTNGTSCIDFATMEEWHKPIVSSHGCGNSRRS